MYTPQDIKRSIRKYLVALLEEQKGWTLRIERREVRDEDRPVAVIELGPESVLRAREALTQGEVETLYPVTVSAYPALPEYEDNADPPSDPIREAEAAAEELKALLTQWLMFGLTVTDVKGQHWAGPMRIPLYDYAETPLTGDKRAMEDDPHDVLWVQRESIAVNAVQDPDDLRRWSVLLDFRVSMEQPGRIRSEDEGYEAEGIEGSYAPPPPEEPEPEAE